MNKTIKFQKQFGVLCSDGTVANKFLSEKVIPLLNQSQKVVFDFEGVKNMNSSFANAMFANLILQKGPAVLKQVSFTNCRENVKVLITSSLDYGFNKKQSCN
ncbi:MAG: STAS-like domain-containing protein [Desulfotalea sp.]